MKSDKPSLLARIFGRRFKDLDGCVVLIWRGMSWEWNPGKDGAKWERIQ